MIRKPTELADSVLGCLVLGCTVSAGKNFQKRMTIEIESEMHIKSVDVDPSVPKEYA